jgi:hypothetical protein
MNYRNGFSGYTLMVCLLAWVLLHTVSSACGAMASSPQEPATPLSQKVKDAELIFYGVVTKLENAVIGPSPGSEDGPLPHTYVTYQIEENLKGRSTEGKSVTLRFLGGSMSDGRHLATSDMPQFKVGEHDLLFVWKNTETDCPLVDCVNGRFHVLKNRMYGDANRPVVGIHKGTILYGNGENRSSEGLTLGEFSAAIEKEVQRLYTVADLQGLKPVRSAKPGTHEGLPFSPEQPAPRVTPPPMVTEPKSEADRAEEEALKQNQGNPVFKENSAR